jgi:uncharacterized membrane protein
MSDLIVIGYDDPATANRAFEHVQTLQRDFIVDLRGLALVDVDADGKEHVHTPSKIVGSSAVSGALWGVLFGLLFLTPGLGLLGGAMGALFGKLAKNGIDDRFRDQVQQMIEPGKSAVVIMAASITEDKFAESMSQFGGHLLKTSLSDAAEKELAESMA